MAEPWWVNLLLLVPPLAYFLWRRGSGVVLTPQQLLTSGIFAAAFGFIEAVVVVYLRAAVGLLPGYQGTLADVIRRSGEFYQQSQAVTQFPQSLLTLEVLREAATILMLLSVALLSNLAKIVVPPELEDADSITRRGTLRRNVDLFFSLWLYWISVLAMMALVERVKDSPAHPSGVFGLLEPAFVARTNTTFIGISEILIANSFIGAVCLFPLAIVFRWAFRRGHVTQLGISPSVQDQSQDDD